MSDETTPSEPSVTMNLTVRVVPSDGETTANPGPIPLPADRDELIEVEKAVLAWLHEDPEHRRIFALDHRLALETAALEQFSEAETPTNRRRRSRDPESLRLPPGVELASLSITVSEKGEQ